MEIHNVTIRIHNLQNQTEAYKTYIHTYSLSAALYTNMLYMDIPADYNHT